MIEILDSIQVVRLNLSFQILTNGDQPIPGHSHAFVNVEDATIDTAFETAFAYLIPNKCTHASSFPLLSDSSLRRPIKYPDPNPSTPTNIDAKALTIRNPIA